MTPQRPSTEHWIDRLSLQVTRRATLKGAVAAGIGLMMPGARAAFAADFPAPKLKCFQSCFDEGATVYRKSVAECQNIGFVHGVIIQLFSLETLGACYAKAQVTARRDFLNCFQPECGDPAKYPGGNKPHAACTPGEELPCGDTCCYTITDCCLNKRTGDYMCCARVPGGETCSCAK